MTEYDPKAVSARIREARRTSSEHLTQDDMARKLGVKPRTFQRWEAGETTGHMRRLDEIARAIGVTTEQLLGVTHDGDGRDLEAQVADLRAQVERLTELLRDPERLLREADRLLP